jgi:hypothetical protein
MGKDNALGYDPLNWMKVTSENKKTPPSEGVNEKDPHVEKLNQHIDSQVTVKQQMPLPTSNNESPDVSKVSESQPQDKISRAPESSATTPKPRVVIGRLYERQPPEKTKSVQHSDNVSQETRRHTELSFSGPKNIHPIRKIDPEINHVPSVARSNFFTYIVIAYTALLLILGYFVYNDLSKRISRIEARIFAIEKALPTKEE